jgi:hypothetical protein
MYRIFRRYCIDNCSKLDQNSLQLARTLSMDPSGSALYNLRMVLVPDALEFDHMQPPNLQQSWGYSSWPVSFLLEGS